MAILIDKNTKYLIQGVTGKEGQRALEWMRNLGSTVVAGVTPGKGGQEVVVNAEAEGESAKPVPVYNSVAEAVAAHPEITATSIYAPPRFALTAVAEAIEAGIPLIHVIAENIPTKDTVQMLELAQKKSQELQKLQEPQKSPEPQTTLERQNSQKLQQLNKPIRIVGPSSIGILNPGKSGMGSLGAGSTEGLTLPETTSDKKGVVVLAKSGGMSLTMSHMISAEGVGITTIVGLGGDKIACTTYADLLSDVAADDETKALVIVGEIGGSYEEDLAKAIQEQNFSKPVVAFISGKFAEFLPQGVAFGHAGAIVSKEFGTRDGKIKALKQAGVLIAQSPEDIVEICRKI